MITFRCTEAQWFKYPHSGMENYLLHVKNREKGKINLSVMHIEKKLPTVLLRNQPFKSPLIISLLVRRFVYWESLEGEEVECFQIQAMPPERLGSEGKTGQ